MNIGPSEFSRGGLLRFGYYMPEAGDTVLRIAAWVESDGQRAYVATVNADGAAPPEGIVYLKSWSENEGVPEALAKAGAVKLLDEFRQCGYAVAQKAELTPAALEELAAQNPKRPPLAAPRKQRSR